VARAGSGSRRQAGPEAESKPIEQVIGSIFSADANVMAKTEVDQVRRCSKIEIARALSVSRCFSKPGSPLDSGRAI
jgi:hypothetical protein